MLKVNQLGGFGGYRQQAAAATLLLDAYPSAFMGFAFRKLRAAHAGSAVRIRRSSDNAEADIGFSGNDFDAAAAAAHIGGGSGFIVTWYDQSGNGNDLPEATSGKQPPYTASGIGSLPGINTVGGTYRVTDTTVDTGGSTVVSNFAVASVNNASDAHARLISFTDTGAGVDYNNAGGYNVARNAGSESIKTEHQGVVGESITYDAAFVYGSVIDPTPQVTTYVGAVQMTQTAFAALQLGALSANFCSVALFQQASNAADNWQGRASEIVIYLSDQKSNAVGIQTNQKTYYGI